MSVITVKLEIPGKKPISVDLTDSVPLRLILPRLKKEISELPAAFDLSLKLPLDRSLVECGVKDGDTLIVVEPIPYVRRRG